jgi:PAS domain S-box-containing protein
VVDSFEWANAGGEVNRASDPRTKRPLLPWNRTWSGGTLLFLIYVATGVGTVLFVEHGAHSSLLAMLIAAPWLAVGVGVTGVLLRGPRVWPAVFVGSWVVWGLVAGDPPLSVTIDAVAEAGSIVLIAHLLSVWGFHRSFDRLRDPLILLAAAAVGRSLDTAFDMIGGFAMAWLAPNSLAPFYHALMTDTAGSFPALTPQLFLNSAHWAMNSIAGIMLVVPLASLRLEDLRKWHLRQPASLIALGLTLSAWTAAALTQPMAAAQPLLITALMLVAWTAVRFGPPAAAFATLSMSLVATAGVGLRMGPLGSSATIQDIGLQWGFISVLALTGLSLTALLAERRRDLEQLRMVAARYQRLFKSNPSPLWVAEPNGGDILMVNDEALRHYGFSEAEFLAMTVAQLNADPVLSSVPVMRTSGSDNETSTVRHRTRAGTTIDVKLLSTPIELDGRPAELCYAVDVSDRFELRSRILASVDLERGRLAQELHDGLGQVLTGLSLGAQAAAVRASRDADIDGTFIDFLVNNSNQAVKLCRQLTRGVSPLQDANGDLLEALHRLPNTVPPGSGPRLDVDVESQAPLSLSLERSEHLYRVVQEAVTNALKHARAAHICVHVLVTPEVVEVSIEDDGVGIQAAARQTNGFGMRSMGLRAAAVGATVEVRERPGGGTIIRCACPQLERIESAQTGQIAESQAAVVPRKLLMDAKAPTPVVGLASGYLGRCLLFAVACFAALSATVLLATIIDPRLDVNGSRLAVPSFLVGLSVAGLIVGGGRLWPGIAMGTLAGAVVLLHQPWLYALYYSADITLAALIVLELLSRWRFSRAFDHWQDPLLLFGAAMVGGSVIQALDFVGTLTYQWLRPGELSASVVALITSAADSTPVVTGAFLSALARWWVDCVAGVVLFVPLLVATPPIRRTMHGKGTEASFWCLSLLGWTTGMFVLSEADARLPLVAMALVLLVWAVVRFGVAMASIATSVCAMAAILSFTLQRGVLTTIGVNEGIDTVWGFLALLTVTGMFLTVLLAERNRMLRELAATAQHYRRLFEHDPHPLWVQDAATGRILMVNEQAIRHYGYSEGEWLCLSGDDLAAKPASAVLVGIARDSGLVETRHRLKNGVIIDVNLSFAPIDMDGRPTLLCFAVDVTERNALRREFLEATDLERRRLANELRYGFGRTLAELEFAATRLEHAADTGQVDSAAVKLIARTSQRAVEICRQIAHSATNARNPFSEESDVRVSLS